MAMKYRNVSAYIVAGGRSRRLGFDKRKINFEGQTLIGRIEKLLSDLLGRAPYFIGDNLDELDVDQERVLWDVKPGCGPAGGLVTALDHCPTDWCLVVAADLPYLSSEDLQLLLHNRSDAYNMICLSMGKYPEPLAAVYPVWTAQFWKDRLERGEYSLMEGIAKIKYKHVVLDPESNALTNINTPEDFKNIGHQPE